MEDRNQTLFDPFFQNGLDITGRTHLSTITTVNDVHIKARGRSGTHHVSNDLKDFHVLCFPKLD
jgi:hypothetical protein